MPKIVLPDPIPRPQLAVTAQGLISETSSRDAATATTILSAQQIEGGLLGLRAGDLVTNLHCIANTEGVGTGYARMALYTTAGVQLGVSGDANAAFTTGGLLTIALASPYTVLTDGGFYVCVLCDLLTTQPTLHRGTSGANPTSSGVGSGVNKCVKQASQASFPAPATFVVTSPAFWFGVS